MPETATAGFFVKVFVGLVFQICLSSVVMWIVMNRMMADIYRTSYLKCLGCVALLNGVGILSALFLLIPGLGPILAIVVWYKCSIVVIEGMFEMSQGALAVLVQYAIVSAILGWIVQML